MSATTSEQTRSQFCVGADVLTTERPDDDPRWNFICDRKQDVEIYAKCRSARPSTNPGWLPCRFHQFPQFANGVCFAALPCQTVLVSSPGQSLMRSWHAAMLAGQQKPQGPVNSKLCQDLAIACCSIRLGPQGLRL